MSTHKQNEVKKITGRGSGDNDQTDQNFGSRFAPLIPEKLTRTDYNI